MSATGGSANGGAASSSIATSSGLEHGLAAREAPIEESSGAQGRSPTGAAAAMPNSRRGGVISPGRPPAAADLGSEAAIRELGPLAGVVTTRRPNGRSGAGFGLQLVELLAARWGVRRAHDTTVWFEMGRA